jgi:hypothetical protein
MCMSACARALCVCECVRACGVSVCVCVCVCVCLCVCVCVCVHRSPPAVRARSGRRHGLLPLPDPEGGHPTCARNCHTREFKIKISEGGTPRRDGRIPSHGQAWRTVCPSPNPDRQAQRQTTAVHRACDPRPHHHHHLKHLKRPFAQVSREGCCEHVACAHHSSAAVGCYCDSVCGAK